MASDQPEEAQQEGNSGTKKFTINLKPSGRRHLDRIQGRFQTSTSTEAAHQAFHFTAEVLDMLAAGGEFTMPGDTPDEPRQKVNFFFTSL